MASLRTRDVIRHSGSVVVLAVDESGMSHRVLLERQYRYAAQQYLWELPAGRIDPGESALAGAKRELIEETGYRAKKWKHALIFYASPGFLDETMTIYLARDLTLGEAQPEADESIECDLVPLSQADRDDLVGQDSRRQDHRRGALAVRTLRTRSGLYDRQHASGHAGRLVGTNVAKSQ